MAITVSSSCVSCESTNATPPGPAVAPGAELIDPRDAAAALAQRWPGGVDPRLRALIPAFDAPFFQAGLAGYSDAAMRLVARRHGAPFCVTEALLDRTLLAGGRGFAKADLGELEDNVPGGAEDHPLAGQIMGSDPREMAAAAMKMVEQGRCRADRDYRALAYPTPGVFPATIPGTTTGARAGTAPRQHLRLPGGVQVGFWDDADSAPNRAADRSTNGDFSGAHIGDSSGAANIASTGACAALHRGHPAPDLGSNLGSTFEVIDVNLACPVKKIDRKARGGHWLREPEGAIEILEAVRAAVPAHIPCSVKLRRSYDDTPEMAANFARIFDATYRIGYSWTTVHARTVEQRYVGPSRWTFLRDLVAHHPDRLIFGSGDVWEAADVFRMIAYTGVAAVSVARGCIGNPWIFRQARDLLAGHAARPPTLAEQRDVLRDHFELALRVNQTLRIRRPEAYTARCMRKFGVRFSAHHPESERVRLEFIRAESLDDWRAVLTRCYADSDSEPNPGSRHTAPQATTRA